jgi:hypothetical protein
MARKKASDALPIGTRIRVKPGTTVPEFPELTCGGWTGTIADSSGKKPDTKYIVEWDDPTLALLPESYVKLCESRGLYHRMVCLDEGVLEPAV